jgi:hypothetical protein
MFQIGNRVSYPKNEEYAWSGTVYFIDGRDLWVEFDNGKTAVDGSEQFDRLDEPDREPTLEVCRCVMMDLHTGRGLDTDILRRHALALGWYPRRYGLKWAFVNQAGEWLADCVRSTEVELLLAFAEVIERAYEESHAA